MKWGRRRTGNASGSYQLLAPDQPIQLNHFLEVIGRDNARLIDDALQVRGFTTSIGPAPDDTGIGPARYQIQASHLYVPDNRKTKDGSNNLTPEMRLSRGQRAIRLVIEQVPGARITGWDRQLLPAQGRAGEPSLLARRPALYDEDGDEGEAGDDP